MQARRDNPPNACSTGIAKYGVRLAVCLPMLLFAVSAIGQESNLEETSPSHVLVLVGTFRSELEELRFVMGRPISQQPELEVSGAAPREVYFQALTMFQKADRLCFEHTRQRETAPDQPARDITPADVREVVDAALQCLRRVKFKYGLDKESPPDALDESKQATDVFISIVQANRQLNLMLDRQFAPGDVFQQVTRAVSYASRSLETFPDATRIPVAPSLEKGKVPADVYRRLLVCFERIRTIAKLSGLEMLELKIDEEFVQQAEPSDVFDIASLLVAELAYLHSKLPDAKPPRKVFDVGRKFPSHVLQRARILDEQLIELERWVDENPGWLSTESNDE